MPQTNLSWRKFDNCVYMRQIMVQTWRANIKDLVINTLQVLQKNPKTTQPLSKVINIKT